MGVGVERESGRHRHGHGCFHTQHRTAVVQRWVGRVDRQVARRAHHREWGLDRDRVVTIGRRMDGDGTGRCVSDVVIARDGVGRRARRRRSTGGGARTVAGRRRRRACGSVATTAAARAHAHHEQRG